MAGRKPKRFHSSHTTPSSINGTLCSVELTHARGGWRQASLSTATIPTPTSQTFLEALQSWDISIAGGFDWLHEDIPLGILVAVRDSSYICGLYPNFCSAASNATKDRGN